MPPAAPGERLAARAGVLLLSTLRGDTCRGSRGSGDLPRVRAAPVARHLRGDGGAAGAGVRVLRRHPQHASSLAVHLRRRRIRSLAVHLQHGTRRLRRVACHGLHSAAAAALGRRRGSAGRVDRGHPGAPRPGHQPAAGPGRRRHHRRRRGLPRALRVVGVRVATAQPGVHGRPLPPARRRPVQPRLPLQRRRSAAVAGADLGRAPAVDRRKLDVAGGGDPPGPPGRDSGERGGRPHARRNRPAAAGRGDRLRPRSGWRRARTAPPGPGTRASSPRITTWSTASSSCS